MKNRTKYAKIVLVGSSVFRDLDVAIIRLNGAIVKSIFHLSHGRQKFSLDSQLILSMTQVNVKCKEKSQTESLKAYTQNLVSVIVPRYSWGCHGAGYKKPPQFLI